MPVERPPDRKCRALPPEFEDAGTSDSARARRLADELLAGEWLSREELDRAQLRRLKALLAFAGKRSRFHARRFRRAGFKPEKLKTLADLRRLPIMTRRDLQDNLHHIKVARLPAGVRVVQKLTTAGSTAAPVQVFQTNDAQLMWVACHARDLVWCGVDPRGSLLSLRHFFNAPEVEEGTLVRQDVWSPLFARHFRTGPLWAMDIGQDIQHISVSQFELVMVGFKTISHLPGIVCFVKQLGVLKSD